MLETQPKEARVFKRKRYYIIIYKYSGKAYFGLVLDGPLHNSFTYNEIRIQYLSSSIRNLSSSSLSTRSSHQQPKFRKREREISPEDPKREREERGEMRLFDPWPVFFKREWKRCWPFLTGFAVTGVLITKLTAGLTGKLLRSDRSSMEMTELILNRSVFVELDRIYEAFLCIVSRG